MGCCHISLMSIKFVLLWKDFEPCWKQASLTPKKDHPQRKVPAWPWVGSHGLRHWGSLSFGESTAEPDASAQCNEAASRQLPWSQLPTNSHPAHSQRKLLPAKGVPHLSLGTDKSRERWVCRAPLLSRAAAHLPWASSIIPGTMMSARARSLTMERAVCSRALQVTLQELRVRTMSGEETTLLQL